MSKTDAPLGTNAYKPYALKRHFYVRIVPAFVFFLALLSTALWLAFDQVTRNIYLEQALHRTELIADSINDHAPQTWQALLSGTVRSDQLGPLREIFAEEIERQKLIKMKVYDLRGEIIYDVNPDNIGTLETSEPFRQTVIQAQPTLLRKTDEQGDLVYEIYTPYIDETGTLRLIFELYEDVGYLDSLLFKSAVPVISVALALQLLFVLVLGFLVHRAQHAIDLAALAIGRLTGRLETFMSNSALSAAKNAHSSDGIASQQITCTLFHSDVRDFTSYAENNPPERVVFFLNDLMSVQVNTLTKFGGDVDKMIGDALLVRFEGENAERRAIEAAQAILDELQHANLARGLGIGIYSGPVISGAIGPKERRDFTVIGDSVNMSARLCSQAKVGEIIADAQTVQTAGLKGFGPPDTISVKGRSEDLTVCRWSTAAQSSKA